MRILLITARLAWRNLWRNHRRTVIMLSAITLGVWAMIAMTAMIRGMVDGMILDSIETLPGHVQIRHPGYSDDPSIEKTVAEPSGPLLQALEGPEVVAWTTRVRAVAVITSERDSRGVSLLGVIPDGERELSSIADDIIEGRFLESPGDPGIVLGRKLVERLETKLGRRVVLMSQDPENELADRGFRIVGIFKSKLSAYEDGFVFAGQETVQKMLRIPGRVTEIAVLGDNYRDVGGLTELLRNAVPADAEVLPWFELDKYLGSMLPMMDGFVLVWIVVVFLALSFGLVNTLVMAVFERVREIGLMLALGMKPAMIMSQVIIESLLLLVIGLLIGDVLAWLTMQWLADGLDLSIVADGLDRFGMSTTLVPALQARDVVMANVTVLILGFLASLSPAWRASRYNPIEAITKV
jgi:ABC-type lipoprotein release transport system permease subunit